MTDLFNRNVIHLFNRDKSHGKEPIITSPDGFQYVETREEINGRMLHFQEITDKYISQQYVIKILEPHSDYPVIKNFLVEGDRLAEFLKLHADTHYLGRIIDIEKYYPSELA